MTTYLEIAVNVPQVSGTFHYHLPLDLEGQVDIGFDHLIGGAGLENHRLYGVFAPGLYLPGQHEGQLAAVAIEHFSLVPVPGDPAYYLLLVRWRGWPAVSVLPVFIASFLLGYLKFGMALVNLSAKVMVITTGALLIVAVLIPRLLDGIKARRKLSSQRLELKTERNAS